MSLFIRTPDSALSPCLKNFCSNLLDAINRSSTDKFTNLLDAVVDDYFDDEVLELVGAAPSSLIYGLKSCLLFDAYFEPGYPFFSIDKLLDASENNIDSQKQNDLFDTLGFSIFSVNLPVFNIKRNIEISGVAAEEFAKSYFQQYSNGSDQNVFASILENFVSVRDKNLTNSLNLNYSLTKLSDKDSVILSNDKKRDLVVQSIDHDGCKYIEGINSYASLVVQIGMAQVLMQCNPVQVSDNASILIDIGLEIFGLSKDCYGELKSAVKNSIFNEFIGIDDEFKELSLGTKESQQYLHNNNRELLSLNYELWQHEYGQLRKIQNGLDIELPAKNRLFFLREALKNKADFGEDILDRISSSLIKSPEELISSGYFSRLTEECLSLSEQESAVTDELNKLIVLRSASLPGPVPKPKLENGSDERLIRFIIENKLMGNIAVMEACQFSGQLLSSYAKEIPASIQYDAMTRDFSI